MKRVIAVCCLALAFALAAPAAQADVTVPTDTPFSHNVGFNYDPWMQSWTAYSQDQYVTYVAKDFDTITEDVRMIHTYHGAGVGTNALVIDPGQYAVMQYAKNNPNKGIELFLCTNEDAATPAKLGTASYATNWVQTILLDPLGDAATVKSVVKAIGIGNEVDAQSVFTAAEMGTAIQNLSAALSAAELGDIPITTSIANLANNPVAQEFVTQVTDNWQTATWGSEFVFANNYPWMQGGDIDTLKTWYGDLQTEFPTLEIFIAETGYPSVSDPSGGFDKDHNFPKVSDGTGEYTYVTGLFSWLGDQYNSSTSAGYTVPTFIFSGTDMPKKVPGYPECSENNYGLYEGSGDTLVLKTTTDGNNNQISIPDWVAKTH